MPTDRTYLSGTEESMVPEARDCCARLDGANGALPSGGRYPGACTRILDLAVACGYCRIVSGTRAVAVPTFHPE